MKNFRTIESLEICKFFDVKTPFRGTQKSACYDLYMPKISNDFIIAFCKRNKCFYDILENNTVFFKTEMFNFETIDKNNIDELSKYSVDFDDDCSTLIMAYFHSDNYVIYNNCTIPSGIGFNIPENCYIDFAPRSSNFNQGYTSIKSVIDEDYTFGTGIQIELINWDEENGVFSELELKEEERIAQFMVKEYVPVEKIVVVEMTDWDIKQEIIDKRESRKGGFGHTGR